MMRLATLLALSTLALCSHAPAAEPIGGWRGNGTGVWKGNPPLTWHRTAKGAMEGLRTQTDRPKDDQPGDATLVEKGQIRQWLVVGPFPVANSAGDFDQDPLGGETTVQPSAGDKVGERQWETAKLAAVDDPDVFGTAEVPWLNLGKQLGFKQHQLGYAHAYLYSPRGGPAKIVADHSWGMKAWLNGKEVFRRVDRQAVLGGYPGLSRIELEHWTTPSSKFDVTLQPGWNRLLLKVSTPGPSGHQEMLCQLRIMDPPDVKYDQENILWMSQLPGRSTSTPIVVGDRIFLMAEPDELLCLDKASGKILWTAANNHFEALTAKERADKPAYAEKVDPLVAKLKAEKDDVGRVKLRAQIQAALEEIDPDRYKIPRDGHFDAHFGIVGYTMPTPISDGKFVYAWCGMGIAACYDLEGHRQWITRVKAGPLTYASTPALSDGVLAVFLNHLFGIDAKTGQIIWEQPKVSKNTAGMLSANINGQEVIVTQESQVVRPKDGKLLYRPRNQVSGDAGWSPGVFVGDVLYQPKYGIKNLIIVDFAGQTGSDWKPKELGIIETPDVLNHRPDGGWLDRSTAASPLVVGKYAYSIDMWSQLCVYDLEAKKVVHHRKLDLHGFTHYNALAVAASPTLVGEHVVILDNQGTALVLTQGPEPKLVHTNVIGTVLERRVPLPGQEILSYAPPVVDGDRLYLRGERFLYCIGK
jgi:outer membrane protein assembly factor BamB